MGLASCGHPVESDTAPPPPPTCDSSDLGEYRFEVDISAAWEPDPEDNTAWVVRSKFSFPDDIIDGTTGFSTATTDTTASGGIILQTQQLAQFEVVARPAEGATLMTLRLTFTCDSVRQTMDFNLDVRGQPMTGREVPITASPS